MTVFFDDLERNSLVRDAALPLPKVVLEIITLFRYMKHEARVRFVTPCQPTPQPIPLASFSAHRTTRVERTDH